MTKKLANAGLIAARESSTLGELVDSFIKLRTGDVKPRTMAKYTGVRKHLIDHFGENRPLKSLTVADAKEFRAFLINKNLSENTVRKVCGVSKTFLNLGIDKELLLKNPFEGVPSAFVATRVRHYYVTPAEIEQVIAQCPDDEWKLIIALARYGGLRTPSETFALTWDDICWEKDRFYVRSPKTERYAGKEGRVVPIFPELRPYLYKCAETAEDGAQQVITKHRPNSHNLRTRFHRIITQAGLVPWQKVFQNLRSSRETELLEQFPIQTVVSWLGNSPQVALQSYLLVRETDFEKAVKSDATGAADHVELGRTKGDSVKVAN
ncbi:tyrosine-type recombinase/integrase [Gimesia sp.]|uniref:tyrosine-type recombinase/integrase n=1 Tax=Gimesia sp. TaxID=2024833 RepID=UPI003A8D99E8